MNHSIREENIAGMEYFVKKVTLKVASWFSKFEIPIITVLFLYSRFCTRLQLRSRVRSFYNAHHSTSICIFRIPDDIKINCNNFKLGKANCPFNLFQPDSFVNLQGYNKTCQKRNKKEVSTNEQYIISALKF